MADVYLSNQAEKFLKTLQGPDSERITAALSLLSQVPVPFKTYDVKKISGFEHGYRIRIGAYRLIYILYPKEQVIRVLKIERKDDSTYKRL